METMEFPYAHTPPSISISIGREPSPMKKKRSGSISGRLRSASEYMDQGKITEEERGLMKEMIIREDVRTEEAFERIEAGDTDRFREILQSSISKDDPYGLDSLTQGLSNFGGASSLGSNAAQDNYTSMFSFECEGSSWLEPTKEEPALRKESDLFQLDMDESRSPETNHYATYRVHKDSLAAIEGDMGVFAAGDKNGFLAVFDDDYREGSLFGQDFLGSNHSMPIGIPNRDRNNSYLSHVSTSPRNQFELKSEQHNYIGAKPKNGSLAKTQAGQAKMKKSTKKNQTLNRKKENGRIQRNPNDRPIVAYPESRELPADLIDKAGPDGRIGSYAPAQRRELLEKFLAKRMNRTWKKKVKYDVRKNFADSRLRVKGRFVKKEDEETLRELMLMTI